MHCFLALLADPKKYSSLIKYEMQNKREIFKTRIFFDRIMSLLKFEYINFTSLLSFGRGFDIQSQISVLIIVQNLQQMAYQFK